jgi:hypothetical protein
VMTENATVDEIVINLEEADDAARQRVAARAVARESQVKEDESRALQIVPVFRKSLRDAVRPKPYLCEIEGCCKPVDVLDHCHETGKFRGWICQSCNVTLGKLGDNAKSLRARIPYLAYLEYLQRFESAAADGTDFFAEAIA